MSKDPHPSIKHQALLDGWSQNADIDPDHFATYQQFKMVLHDPTSRMNALNQIDEQIGNENTTLRQRSQLLDLRRRLSVTHEQLLKARR